ncbi:MAG: Ig domain-containing protein [Terricaulis sp.]
MRGAWRPAIGKGLRHPVEMRFVDMFMTALGSLIFMALLLVFVIVNFPTEGLTPPEDAPVETRELLLATKTMPQARPGERYETALAYRGGVGAIRWSLSTGEGGLPPGVEFNADEGAISGTPVAVGVFRFTVTAVDARNNSVSRGYEIEVKAPPVSSKAFNLWVAGILALVLAYLGISYAGNSMHQARLRAHASKLHALGLKTMPVSLQGRGEGSYELPGAIDHFAQAAGAARNKSILAFLGAGAAVGYIFWVLNGA